MALVRKILETTIPSGGTTAIFTDSDIPNSLIRVYSTNNNIYPQSMILSGNTLTVTYEETSGEMGVALELVKQGLTIIDDLTSTDSTAALSAAKGKSLKDSLDTLSSTVSGLDIPENITDLDDVNVTSISDGQVLAWDDDSSKFVNVNQSGGGASENYSTEEVECGFWVDNRRIYKKTYVLENSLTLATYTWTSTGIDSTGIDIIIKGEFIRIDTKGYIACSFNPLTNSKINIMNLSDYSLSCSAGSMFTIYYVKEVI